MLPEITTEPVEITYIWRFDSLCTVNTSTFKAHCLGQSGHLERHCTFFRGIMPLLSHCELTHLVMESLTEGVQCLRYIASVRQVFRRETVGYFSDLINHPPAFNPREPAKQVGNFDCFPNYASFTHNRYQVSVKFL
jgi:hypothetical protein